MLAALDRMKRGVRWDPSLKIMIWTQEAEPEYADKDPETTTMEAFLTMASSILGCLYFTWDLPFKNVSMMMPVLDMQMWVGLPTRSWDLPGVFFDPGNEIPTKKGAIRKVIMAAS